MVAASGEGVRLESMVPRKVALARATLGLVQGVLLFALYQAYQEKTWPVTEGLLFAPLVLIGLFIPVLLISALGHMDRKRILAWVATASVVVGVLAVHDIWRLSPDEVETIGDPRRMPSFLVVLASCVGLFIAHSLVLAAAVEKRRVASYHAHFEIAWKLAIQIMFSGLFVGVLWLVLWLGASLFMLLKLEFLKELLLKPWFSIPVSSFAFSLAFHLTDVRPGIVRGIRSLLLGLMSWLLPLAALIVSGFLLSLPFTGLAPLWATRHATAVLLGTAVVLVLLINAAFQDGDAAPQVARLLRWSARLGAVLLTPIVVIAIYSLGLRVREYGWTPDRVMAAASLLVAGCYAAGYLWAALDRGAWLRRVAPTNMAVAFLMLAVLLAIFTPMVDPARISVASQLGRLEAGKTAATFDFDFLRFGGERYGWSALQALKNHAQPTIREKVATTLAKRDRWDREGEVASVQERTGNITVWPKGSTLERSFLTQEWPAVKLRWAVPECLLFREKRCDAYLIDFSGDGQPEVLLIGERDYARSALLQKNAKGVWEVVGSLGGMVNTCPEFVRKQLAAGAYRVQPPPVQDLEVAGQRIHVMRYREEDAACPP